ncbi:MAG TPA: hypothetical protein DCG49_11220 [Ruminococcus sp.]|nr:hypothetical protein [Ruminococcus sp.]
MYVSHRFYFIIVSGFCQYETKQYRNFQDFFRKSAFSSQFLTKMQQTLSGRSFFRFFRKKGAVCIFFVKHGIFCIFFLFLYLFR